MESTSTLSRLHRTQIGWRFWLQWVVANAFGFGIGSLFGVMIILRSEGITDIGVSGLIVILGWTVAGVSVGIMQWLALLTVRSDARWIVATIVGCAAGLGIIFALSLARVPPVLPSFLAAPGLGFAYGAGAGLFQTLILRCSIRRAAIWVLVSAAGWALGFALWDPLQAILWAVGNTVGIFAGGGVVGAASGVITGFALVWLLRPNGQADI
jgi:hypothetical protein